MVRKGLGVVFGQTRHHVVALSTENDSRPCLVRHKPVEVVSVQNAFCVQLLAGIQTRETRTLIRELDFTTADTVLPRTTNS